MSLNAIEQYILELINRARLDPSAEAERYGLGLNVGLKAGTISTTPKQVLAPNEYLEVASEQHSMWMLSSDIFSHTGQAGSSPGMRMLDAGYDFAGTWSWRENLAWTGTTGTLDLQNAADVHHDGLYRSEGHRANTFATDIREIGVAQIQGKFTNDNTTYNASMLTLNFAQSGSDLFLTGVAFSDEDSDGFYDVGEGIDDLTVVLNDEVSDVSLSGGYTNGGAPDGNAQVELFRSGELVSVLEIDLGKENAKLDYVIDPSNEEWVYASQDLKLISGLSNAKLLGAGNIDLTGSAANNELLGNAGQNDIRGGAGNDILRGGVGRDGTWHSTNKTSNSDTLLGGSGNDRLYGQSGADSLDGGAGDDILKGGGGRDSFVFSEGSDTILDFAETVDQLILKTENLGVDDLTASTLADFSSVTGNDLLLDFGNGHQLVLEGIGSLTLITDDILFG